MSRIDELEKKVKELQFSYKGHMNNHRDYAQLLEHKEVSVARRFAELSARIDELNDRLEKNLSYDSIADIFGEPLRNEESFLEEAARKEHEREVLNKLGEVFSFLATRAGYSATIELTEYIDND